jgi:hypothetical protein
MRLCSLDTRLAILAQIAGNLRSAGIELEFRQSRSRAAFRFGELRVTNMPERSSVIVSRTLKD